MVRFKGEGIKGSEIKKFLKTCTFLVKVVNRSIHDDLYQKVRYTRYEKLLLISYIRLNYNIMFYSINYSTPVMNGLDV